MRFDATRPLQNAIWPNSGGFVPALVLILAALPLAARPARAAGSQAQPPPAKQPGNARPAARQTTAPNAAATQTGSPEVVPVSPQDLPQDPLRSAIQNGIQKGTQEEKPYPAAAPAKQPAAGNTAPSTSPNTNATSSEPPAVNTVPNPNQPATATLVCKGTRANGAAFTFPFEANTSPAPTAGDACVPSGKKIPKGTAVMGTAPKASTVFAVVFVPPSTPSATPNESSNTNAPSNTTPNAHLQPKPKQPAAAPTGPIPPEINAGIKAMVSAEASLGIAGNKWGGHKEPAMKLIDQALTACGQNATPDDVGTKSNPAADTAAMEAALTQLTNAEKDFTNAKNPWGECRDKAKAQITQALSQVQAGIAFAKSHNTY